MKRATSAVLAFVSLLLLSSIAHAQAFRAYVSSAGSDANPCTVVAPCRLLPAALSAVASGGEIWILDSANYNSATLNINKSVTILAIPGAVGSIVAVAGGPAITINTAGITVALRNIVIANNAVSPGTYGIQMTNGKTLVLEHCLIQNVPAQGILAGGASMIVYVKDSEFRSGGHLSIEANDGATVDVVRTKMSDNFFGGVWAHPLTATGVAQVFVTDSEISGSVASGIGLYSFAAMAGGIAKIFANRVSISNVGYGITTIGSGTSTIEIGNSMVVRNGFNVYIGTGAIRSLGNNHISDGTSADSGSLTTLAPR